MSTHAHHRMKPVPVILEYKGYRIVRHNDLNLKMLERREPGGKEKEGWAWCGYYSSLKDAIRALLDKLVSTPQQEGEGPSGTLQHILGAIADLEDYLDTAIPAAIAKLKEGK